MTLDTITDSNDSTGAPTTDDANYPDTITTLEAGR